MKQRQQDYVSEFGIPACVYAPCAVTESDAIYASVVAVMDHRIKDLAVVHNKGVSAGACDSLEPHEVKRLLESPEMSHEFPTSFVTLLVYHLLTTYRLSRGGGKTLREWNLNRFKLFIHTFPNGARALAVKVAQRGIVTKVNKPGFKKPVDWDRADVTIFDAKVNWAEPGRLFAKTLVGFSLPILIAFRMALATKPKDATKPQPLFLQPLHSYRSGALLERLKNDTGLTPFAHCVYGTGTEATLDIWDLDSGCLVPRVVRPLFDGAGGTNSAVGATTLQNSLKNAAAGAGLGDKKISNHGTATRIMADALKLNGATDADYDKCGWKGGSRMAAQKYTSDDTANAPSGVFFLAVPF